MLLGGDVAHQAQGMGVSLAGVVATMGRNLASYHCRLDAQTHTGQHRRTRLSEETILNFEGMVTDLLRTCMAKHSNQAPDTVPPQMQCVSMGLL